MSHTRFWTALALLVGTTGVLYGRGDVDKVPASEPVASMPRAIGPWTGHDITIDQSVLDILGKGDFVERTYTAPGTSPAPIDLFIGYFPTQRTGQTIHSPQHCLPGAGWTFESSKYTRLRADDGTPYNVGEYVITNGEARQYVLYWYQAHGRSIANEYVSKFYLIADAMRYNRTDGALVRVITPILPGEPTSSARARAIQFTQQMAPDLHRVIPA